MKKIAIILSGCGVYDGSEIHEATLTMLAITKQGAQYSCFAPDIQQHHVINHITGNEMEENRNVLIESARIARGNISSLSELSINEFDALVLPGGFGAAKNLSDFAFNGENCTVNKEVADIIKAFHKAKKPIGALCIAPAIIACIINNAQLTIGNDQSTAKIIEDLGSKHQNTSHGEIVYDELNKIITTPCYMLDANIEQIESGAIKLMEKLIEII